MSLSVSNAEESLEKLQQCLMGVSVWMTGSKLKLNPSKTEFLLIGTKLPRNKILHNFPCLILGEDTNPSALSKNLGVFPKNTYPKHVGHASIISAICVEFEKVCPLDLAKQIAVVLVSRKLDYCNSLFHNMPEKDIARLQRVQNCLARVVITKTPRFNRSAPTLKRLHRLPVKFRIHFKIAQ